jgi:hypothetical protein
VTATRVLVTGWFSLDDGEITAGDMLACETLRGWLSAAGVPQPEYGERGRHDVAERLVRDVMRGASAAPLELDTRLDEHDELSCRTAARFTSLIARVDAVVTTRMHGFVLALRASVPAVALDPIAGDAKVAARARAAACSQSGRRGLEQTHMELLELLTGGGARAPAQ